MTDLVTVLLYVGAIGLIAIGIVGVVLSRHLLRMVLALSMAEAGANLLLVLTGYRWDAVAPIIERRGARGPMVDPVPQALVLTSIVIGVGVQALARRHADPGLPGLRHPGHPRNPRPHGTGHQRRRRHRAAAQPAGTRRRAAPAAARRCRPVATSKGTQA